jgi:hypothetical protein
MMIVAIDPTVFMASLFDDDCKNFLVELVKRLNLSATSKESDYEFALDDSKTLAFHYSFPLRHAEKNGREDICFLLTGMTTYGLKVQNIKADNAKEAIPICESSHLSDVETVLVRMAEVTPSQIGKKLVIVLPGNLDASVEKKLQEVYTEIETRPSAFQRKLYDPHRLVPSVIHDFWNLDINLDIRYAKETRVDFPLELETDDSHRLLFHSWIFELLVPDELTNLYPGTIFKKVDPKLFGITDGSDIDVYGESPDGNRIFVGECKLRGRDRSQFFIGECNHDDNFIDRVRKIKEMLPDKEIIPFYVSNSLGVHRDFRPILRGLNFKYFRATLSPKDWYVKTRWKISSFEERNDLLD